MTAGRGPAGPPRRAGAVTTRADRTRDLIALALVVAGVGLIATAHAGNTRLATQHIVVSKGHDAFSQWMHYYRLEFTGYGAILAGILVGLASYVIHARRERRAGAAGGAV